MKIVFFGNADFGLQALKALLKTKHNVVAVVTNEDKKIGRNQKIKATPIKKIAIKENLNLIDRDLINSTDFVNDLKDLSADIYIVIAYKILPKIIYSIPKHGAINLHASILPSYRGAAPIQRAIISNEKYTGLTSFFINEEIDAGELIYQKRILIDEKDNFEDVWRKLSNLSGGFIVKTLDYVLSGDKKIEKNLPSESFAPKICKEELRIDWGEDSNSLNNKIRAFSPYPCMYSTFQGKRVKIIKSSVIKNSMDQSLEYSPGELCIKDKRLIVKCKEDWLEILSLQPESKKQMLPIEFINGYLEELEGQSRKYEFK